MPENIQVIDNDRNWLEVDYGWIVRWGRELERIPFVHFHDDGSKEITGYDVTMEHIAWFAKKEHAEKWAEMLRGRSPKSSTAWICSTSKKPR